MTDSERAGRYYDFYTDNPIVAENSFIGATPTHAELPSFEANKHRLPQPIWEGHEDFIDCYWKTWELAFKNLDNPTSENGFVAPYIDTAFNNNIFMWDSAFILMFARYGQRVFNFQQTLDNFYAKQHCDGFICREIRQSDGTDCFHRFDPSSTGPNIMPWAEWEYYQSFGDKERLERVYPSLVAYYDWFQAHRTWPDGTYWANGWSSGMDHQPRVDRSIAPSHGHHVWADTCFQQIFAANLLCGIAEILNGTAEAETLSTLINDRLWDEQTAFYYDLDADGQFIPVKSIGAYWALLAHVVSQERLPRFIEHLENEAEFKRPHRVPSLSADHAEYKADGGYWMGGVWAPTNYMVLRGLREYEQDALAHEIALNHVRNVVEVYKQTGTVWENYAPEVDSPGNPAKGDFVGWTGLSTIAIPLEFIFGLSASAPKNKIVWDVRLTEKHGVLQYPFGKDGLIDLVCERRSSPEERPNISVRSNIAVTLEIRWNGQHELIPVTQL